MSNEIVQLSVKALLGGDSGKKPNYQIPMYQRNYAWGESDITQLIQDVLDEMPEQTAENEKTKPYYIGTLVVHQESKDKNTDKPLYEVIDGQQRLTTLFLLASYFRHSKDGQGKTMLDWFKHPCVRFESRPHSSKAMQAVYDGKAQHGDTEKLHTDEFNRDIINGYELIQTLIPALCRENDKDPARLADYLFSSVQIMRVKVPEDTDLNHYFEIMNNRGEQLEKHEILKSRLMSKLDEAADRSTLHKVWEACANMECYVQMGFITEQREKLFGTELCELQPKDFDQLRELLVSNDENTNLPSKDGQSDESTPLSLSKLIAPSSAATITDKGKKDSTAEAPERFNSVINFPNFLLQVLRASTGENIPLDDKRLIKAFDEHILRNTDAKIKIKEFIYNLLKCKHLFDHYIIKRELIGNTEGWSLKRLKRKEGGNYYADTFDSDNRQILMLLSALHVSAPAMAYKYWLNAALLCLFDANAPINSTHYLKRMESVTRGFMYDRFLAKHDVADYYQIVHKNKGNLQAINWSDNVEESKLIYGSIANNLVFNYLDYLLWVKRREDDPKVEEKVEKFEFTFRSSVEHYFPQKPRYQIKVPENVDCFGNLCLISHSKNSLLSNLDPEAKKGHYRKGDLDSIKQWLMMKETSWDESAIKKHHAAMLEVLKNDFDRAKAS